MVQDTVYAGWNIHTSNGKKRIEKKNRYDYRYTIKCVVHFELNGV